MASICQVDRPYSPGFHPLGGPHADQVWPAGECLDAQLAARLDAAFVNVSCRRLVPPRERASYLAHARAPRTRRCQPGRGRSPRSTRSRARRVVLETCVGRAVQILLPCSDFVKGERPRTPTRFAALLKHRRHRSTVHDRRRRWKRACAGRNGRRRCRTTGADRCSRDPLTLTPSSAVRGHACPSPTERSPDRDQHA